MGWVINKEEELEYVLEGALELFPEGTYSSMNPGETVTWLICISMLSSF